MTPGQVFLLALALLYLSDCFLLVPRRGFAFLNMRARGRWRVALPSTALGNDRGGLVMTMPLPPLGRALVTGLWPISMSARGFTGVVTACPNPGMRPPLRSGVFRWDDLKEVGWEGRDLLVNGRRFLRLASPQVARAYSVLFLTLARTPEAGRAVVIESWCRRELSARRVRHRLRVFERVTSALRATCNALFFVAFVAVPLTYWYFGAAAPFFFALVAAGLLMVTIGVQFWCLHRRLYPEQGSERLQLWLLVGFMPQYAIRAVDELSKGLLANVHPLAAAEALLDDAGFRRFRDAVLRDLDSPVPQVLCGEEVDAALALAVEFREQFEEPALRAVAARRLGEPVRRAPEPQSLEAGSAEFCPRCLMPYEVGSGECLDCGGVETVPLGGGAI